MRAAIDLLAMTALLASYEGVWQGSFPGHVFVLLAGFFAIAAFSHRRRGETWRDLGFRADTARAALRGVTVWLGPVFPVLAAAGIVLGSLRWSGAAEIAFLLAVGVLWGTLQQYALLGFHLRRLEDVMGGGIGSSVAAAALFSAYHAPNPLLMAITAVAGLVACRIYRRAPNVPVLGVAHGLLSFAISHSLPLHWTVGMRVGQSY